MKKWPVVLIAAAFCAIFFAGTAWAQETYFSAASWPYLGNTSSGYGLAVDPGGNFVYVINASASVIYKSDASGNVLAQWSVPYPSSAYVADAYGHVYVGSAGNIMEYDSNGNLLGSWTFSTAQYKGANGMAVGPNGNVYLSYHTGRDTQSVFYFSEYTPSGSLVTTFPAGTGGQPAVDSSGDVYIAGSYCVSKYGPSGSLLSTIGTCGTMNLTNGFTGNPTAVQADGAGNIYVQGGGYYLNGVGYPGIVKFDQNGNFLTNLASWREVDESGNCAGGWVGAASQCDGGNGGYGRISINSLSVDTAGQIFSVDSQSNAHKFVGSGVVNATVLDGNGNPVQGAYLYVQPGPMLMADRNATDIIGPSGSDGLISGTVPMGPWYFRIMARAAGSTVPPFAPPYKGDLTWVAPGHSMTVPENGVLALGTVNLSPYGASNGAGYSPQTSSMTISGTVTGGQTNSPMSNWFVFATTSPIHHTPPGPSGEKYAAQALTDASGNYTISFCHPGTYYIYACSAPGACNCNSSFRGGCKASYPNPSGGSYEFPGGYPTCNTVYGTFNTENYYWDCPTTVNANSNVTGVNISVMGQ